MSDILLLLLGGCDLVLGVQWLSTLGIIKWDFDQLKMEFSYSGHPLTLRDIKVQKPRLLPQGQLSKAFKTATHLCMLQIVPKKDNQPNLPAAEHGIPPALQPLIDVHTDLFQEPTTLPPSRGPFDHKIPLKEGTSSINLRPYRFP